MKQRDFKFTDWCIQQEIEKAITRELDLIHSECITSTCFGTKQINTETRTEEKLHDALKKLNDNMKIYKEDTVRWLSFLGFKIIVNDFMSDDTPIIILPANYKVALQNMKEKTDEN